MKKTLAVTIILVLALTATAAVPALASAGGITVWSENWDSYPAGQDMHGVHGWKGWDNTPEWTAHTVSSPSLSSPDSIAIGGITDLVHEYSGCTSGVWLYSAWQYVPDNFRGLSFFLLLNIYNDGGPYSWSTQVVVDGDSGEVYYTDEDTEGSEQKFPLIRDEWVELRTCIDLDNDIQRVYYGEQLLMERDWAWYNGATSIAAVDLYSETASYLYYDDLSLTKLSPLPRAVVGGEVRGTDKFRLAIPWIVLGTGIVITCLVFRRRAVRDVK